MSNQNIVSDLFADLSTEEQQLMSGGRGRRRAIICYDWEKFRNHDDGRNNDQDKS